MACQFCRTNSKGEPCPYPKADHPEGITIHAGPNKDGTYIYTVEWYDESVKRGRGQVFRTIPTLAVRNSPAWSDAWQAYRKDKL